jgi:hypothetical protein
MKTKLTVGAALAGTLLATCLVTSSAQAASVPVLKSDATPGIVTLVGKKGGGGGKLSRGGGGGGKFSRSGGGRHAYGGGGGKKHYGGGGGKKHYGGGGGKKHYGGGGDRKHYAYKGGKRYGHDGRYRRYGSYGLYGAPFLAYGAYAGSCGWMYRNAVATGDPYWWNRYYECVGYY